MIIPFIQKKNFLRSLPSISPDANAEDDETDDDGFAALDAKAIRVVFLSLVFVWRERRAFVNS